MQILGSYSARGAPRAGVAHRNGASTTTSQRTESGPPSLGSVDAHARSAPPAFSDSPGSRPCLPQLLWSSGGRAGGPAPPGADPVAPPATEHRRSRRRRAPQPPLHPRLHTSAGDSLALAGLAGNRGWSGKLSGPSTMAGWCRARGWPTLAGHGDRDASTVTGMAMLWSGGRCLAAGMPATGQCALSLLL